MTQTSGQAAVNFSITDLSVLIQGGLKGVHAVQGITERGDPTKTVGVSSWTQYQNYFGGFVSGSIFPIIMWFALNAGGVFKIRRAVHYSDPTDASTVVGVEATGTLGTTATPETRATAGATVSNSGSTGDEFYLFVTKGAGLILLGSYINGSSDSATTVAVGLKTAINANTGGHGFTATNTAGALTISAPVGSGAAANSYVLSDVVATTGSGAITLASSGDFSGGITAIIADSTGFVATSIGPWGNNLTVTTTINAVNSEGVDISYVLTGYPNLNKKYSNFPLTGAAQADMDQFNATMPLVNFSALPTGTFPIGSVTLTDGAYDPSLVVDADYIGDSTAKTGLYGFGSDGNLYSISVPEVQHTAIDDAISAYVTARGDLKGLLTTPLGVTGPVAIAYRNRTSPYTDDPIPIDNWMCSLWTGGLSIPNPTPGANGLPSNVPISITELAGVYGCASRRSNSTYAWFSTSGPKRGLIANTLGVLYNFMDAGVIASGESDAIAVQGINPVVNDPTYGVMAYGNFTLQKAKTLLSFDNVADLVLYTRNTILPIAKSDLFDPNDIDTWKDICKRVDKPMKLMKNNGGVRDYIIQGDQNITDISQAVVNSPDNIDAGAYTFNLWMKPVNALIYIGINVVITNSSYSYTTLPGQPNG